VLVRLDAERHLGPLASRWIARWLWRTAAKGLYIIHPSLEEVDGLMK